MEIEAPIGLYFLFSRRRRHTRLTCDWSADVCSSDLHAQRRPPRRYRRGAHHRCKGSAACACDDDVPYVRISEGERERLTLNWRVGKATLMPLAPRTSELRSRAAADCTSLQIPAPTI